MKHTPNIYCFAVPASHNPHDVQLKISAASRRAFDSLPHGESEESIVARDAITRSWWAIRRHPCALQCYCAAQAQPVKDPNTKVVWPKIRKG